MNFARRKRGGRTPQPVPKFVPQPTGADELDRQLQEIGDALDELQSEGDNLITISVEPGGADVRVIHALGRTARGSIRVSSDRWAATDFIHDRAGNPHPDRELWLRVDVAATTQLTLLVI